MTNLPWEPQHRALLEQAAPEAQIVYVSMQDAETLQREMADATVALIIGRPDISAAKQLAWMHWDAAGLDAIAQKDYIDAGFDITGSAGRNAEALAEHCIYFMLLHAYHTRDALAAQAAHRWGGYARPTELHALFSQTVGIVGMGYTGKALASRCKALGMRVLAYSRHASDCPDVDEMYA